MKQASHYLVVLFALILVACEVPATLSIKPTATSQEGCSLPVGIITSLTGNSKADGEEQLRGYELARDDINGAGGIGGCSLRLVINDDQSNQDLARSAAETLIKDTGALAVVGSLSTESTLQVQVAIDKYGVPLLVPSSTTDQLTQANSRWTFRIHATNGDLVRATLTFVRHSAPLQLTLALIYDNTITGFRTKVMVESIAEDAGLSIINEEIFQPGATDLQPLLERIKRANPDMILFAVSDLNDIQRVLRQIQAVNLNAKIYLGTGGAFLSPRFAGLGPETAYAITPTQWAPSLNWHDEQGQTGAQFVERFRSRYQVDAGARSVMAYTNLMVLRRALDAVMTQLPQPTADLKVGREAVRAALQNLRMNQTLLGPIAFDDHGQNQHQPVLTQVLGGVMIVVAPDDLRTTPPVVPAPPWNSRTDHS
jgi:branched-chain amino acid transport system substrate-binding protein